jgi:hypothetical protein
MVQRRAIQDIDPWFHWTSGGYHGLVHPGRLASPLPFESWDTSGAFVGETGSYTTSSAPDGRGGSIVLARETTPTGAALGPTQLEWVDASGTVKRSVPLDRDAGFVLSNWGTGHVLVAVAGSGASGRWFDASGNALTPWFGLGDLGILTAHLLADGTIVLADNAGWRLALRDGVPSADAVPGWLAARPQTRLATIRHAAGYAVLPLEGNGGSFEIVTAAGESCGSFTLPPAPVVAGETRTPGQRLDVGQDGTLLELSFVSTVAPSFGIHCNFRWWPGLLR